MFSLLMLMKILESPIFQSSDLAAESDSGGEKIHEVGLQSLVWMDSCQSEEEAISSQSYIHVIS